MTVKPGYPVNKPWFVYDSSDGKYYRYQYGDKQIDASDEQQVAVENIIFQYIPVGYEDEKYLKIPTAGSGSGKYITNGKAVDITWKKEDYSSKTRFYDKAGNEITLNQGKTWVCVINDSETGKVEISATEE